MVFEFLHHRRLWRFASSHALNHHVYSKPTNSNIVNFHEEEARVSMDLLLGKGRKFQRNEKSGRCILSVLSVVLIALRPMADDEKRMKGRSRAATLFHSKS